MARPVEQARDVTQWKSTDTVLWWSR